MGTQSHCLKGTEARIVQAEGYQTYGSNGELDHPVPVSKSQKPSYSSSDRSCKLCSSSVPYQSTVLQGDNKYQNAQCMATHSFANTPLKAAQVPLATANTIHELLLFMIENPDLTSASTAAWDRGEAILASKESPAAAPVAAGICFDFAAALCNDASEGGDE